MHRLAINTYNAIRFCPMCAKELEHHPISGNKACFLHGDFVVTEDGDKVSVKFDATNWMCNAELG